MAAELVPAAVVFDCDGVLVNTEELAWEAWTTALAEQAQPPLNEIDIIALTGPTKAENIVYLSSTRELLEPDRLLLDFDRYHGLLLETQLRAYPDAVETVTSLAEAGVSLAVASNSAAAWVKMVISATGALAAFATVVSAEEVARPKPAPDVYAEAVSRLDVPPSTVVAVEDSPTGIASARAAGLAVLGLRRGGFVDSELVAAHVLADQVNVAAIGAALRRAGAA